MPAHLSPLPGCQTCGSAATDELRDTENVSFGVYCGRHGPPALRDLQQHENLKPFREV